jgi:hypothetical protein
MEDPMYSATMLRAETLERFPIQSFVFRFRFENYAPTEREDSLRRDGVFFCTASINRAGL